MVSPTLKAPWARTSLVVGLRGVVGLRSFASSQPLFIRGRCALRLFGQLDAHQDASGIHKAAPTFALTPLPACLPTLSDCQRAATKAFLVFPVSLLAPAYAAVAASDAAAYNPAAGADTLKSVAGIAYIGIVVFFFFRLFQRRAQKATSERIASVAHAAALDGEDSDSEDEREEELGKKQAEAQAVTPLQSLIGALQAGVIAYLLFQASTTVDAFFDRQGLPDPYTQYTAHNVAVLVQTVCRGLVYLITFIFGANAVGLAGLTIQLLLYPETGLPDDGSRPTTKPLPKVSLTDDLFALRRAFQEAESMGQKQAERELKRSKTQSSSDE